MPPLLLSSYIEKNSCNDTFVDEIRVRNFFLFVTAKIFILQSAEFALSLTVPSDKISFSLQLTVPTILQRQKLEKSFVAWLVVIRWLLCKASTAEIPNLSSLVISVNRASRTEPKLRDYARIPTKMGGVGFFGTTVSSFSGWKVPTIIVDPSLPLKVPEKWGRSWPNKVLLSSTNIIYFNPCVHQSFHSYKGFIVGNAVTDNYHDSIGTVSYWWSHSMISDRTYNSIIKSCDFKSVNSSQKCDDAVNYAMNHEFGDIDQYSIYTTSCKAMQDSTKHSMRLKNTLLRPRFSGYDPCTENYAEKYYNRPDVQKAMHANTTGVPYKWTACSDVLIRNWKDSEVSMLPTYEKLIAAGLRIWVFSGDTDSVVPVTATRFSLSHLNLKVKTPWYPWYSASQVGGWTEVYNGLTFATIRGAGHEVPLFQPRRAFILFKTFLAGKDLPKSSAVS
ncbi:serine carboxypeptidase 24-like [Olea europaea var. sylvestris]|uniref:serine carboxypeptidase 24-like n=1 Tax=Olea europaea var. sylvestris TaxID=158386 RepID=UPI000C1D5830|nr:serine carboxypeptidase 24-like [Olea europaea var. sylvestris]